MNSELRIGIARMIQASGEGHIPSSFSIVDIIEYLYGSVLVYDSKYPDWTGRDYFILSKGHGCAALYVVLEKYGFLSKQDLDRYGSPNGILGGHPDSTQIPGVEASTGSLGHGLATAMGVAVGLRILGSDNRVFVLVGDGECHEGTIWESANVANNLQLGNLCAIVDWNGSAAQLMPRDDLSAKWKAFGWDSYEVDGHSTESLDLVQSQLKFSSTGAPKVVLARTTKGKGVSFTEGHGRWHHRIPNDQELLEIITELEQ